MRVLEHGRGVAIGGVPRVTTSFSAQLSIRTCAGMFLNELPNSNVTRTPLWRSAVRFSNYCKLIGRLTVDGYWRCFVFCGARSKLFDSNAIVYNTRIALLCFNVMFRLFPELRTTLL